MVCRNEGTCCKLVQTVNLFQLGFNRALHCCAMEVPAIVTIAEPQSRDTGNLSPLKSQLANENSLTSEQPNAL